MSTAAQDLEQAVAEKTIVIRKNPEPGVQERVSFPDASVCERLDDSPADPLIFKPIVRWRATAGDTMAHRWMENERDRMERAAEHVRASVERSLGCDSQRGIDALVARADELGVTLDPTAKPPRDPAEPPEGWRWVDGRLVHRDGRAVTIGEWGLSCWRPGWDERMPVPLDVARYLLAWRECGQPCAARDDRIVAGCVVRGDDGRKHVVADEESAAGAQDAGMILVCARPHEDGDFSYLCGSRYCRCCS